MRDLLNFVWAATLLAPVWFLLYLNSFLPPTRQFRGSTLLRMALYLATLLYPASAFIMMDRLVRRRDMSLRGLLSLSCVLIAVGAAAFLRLSPLDQDSSPVLFSTTTSVYIFGCVFGMLGLGVYARRTSQSETRVTTGSALFLLGSLWLSHWLLPSAYDVRLADLLRCVYVAILCLLFVVANSASESRRQTVFFCVVALVLFQVLFGTGLFISLWMSPLFFWLLVLVWPLLLLALATRSMFVGKTGTDGWSAPQN